MKCHIIWHFTKDCSVCKDKITFMTIMHHNLEISTCDDDNLKYKMDNTILIIFYQRVLENPSINYVFIEKKKKYLL